MKFLAYLLIITAFFVNTPQSLAAQEFEGEKEIIRVGLSNSAFSTFEFTENTIITSDIATVTNMTAGDTIKDIPKNTEITTVLKDGTFFVTINGKEVIKNAEGPILIVSNGKLGVKNLSRKGNPAYYRGMIELKTTPNKKKFNVINVLDAQSYLKGVVPNEMPVSFGLNALKAQAVAARNYANRPQNAYTNYDICDSTACQVYYGANSENPLSDRAVEETEGIFALYDKKPILALYSSTSGGITEDYDCVYGNQGSFSGQKPYLKSVKDNDSLKIPKSEKELKEFYSTDIPSFDIKSSKHRWKVVFDRFELEETLSKTLREQSLKGLVYPAFGESDEVYGLEDIKVLKRGESGKALELEIRSVSGIWRVKKELGIRRTLKKGKSILWSGNFVVEKSFPKTPETRENTLLDTEDACPEKVSEKNKAKKDHSKTIFTFENPENEDAPSEKTEITAEAGNKKIYKNGLGMPLPEVFTFIGAGFGHGVGLSQYGAGYLSAQGVGYDAILKHYYSQITLGTMPLTVAYNNYNQNYTQSAWFDVSKQGTAGPLPASIGENPLKEEIKKLHNASNKPPKYILNIDNSKRVSAVEFYVNGYHFTPDMTAFGGKIIKTDITKYLKNGKNTITFLPLKAVDKEKTITFMVEIEK